MTDFVAGMIVGAQIAALVYLIRLWWRGKLDAKYPNWM